ncbi:hypothetical protein NQF87_01860 [Bombella sp. TMW 2.2559]|uniref:Lipoprotein n=1 Tax=Bombella dulcis TaxID=2967339 RepID=A0ABT3W9I3_9PROT|nr:hypothetical protein [Bombella dulcis]MCX5615726.1 hypothetical protein [Bombella dulcis]
MTFRKILYRLTCMLPLGLSACGYWDALEAHKAQYEMVGMTTYDLQACAGAPNSTKTLSSDVAIWEYDISRSVATVSSTQGTSLFPINIPDVINGYQQLFGKPGSACRMLVRIDHDRISEVHYAGDDDEYIGEDGICSMITRGCARQPEGTMRDAPGIWPMGPISAFHSMPTEDQRTDATYSDKSGKFVPNYDHKPGDPLIQPAPKDGSIPKVRRNNGLINLYQGDNGLPIITTYHR